MGRTGDPREWRAKNGNLLVGELPSDALELMNDPRVQGMRDPLPGFSATTVALQPAEPVSVESGYWMAQTTFKARPESGARWVNEPKTGWGPGWGLGFDEITERPRIEQAKKAPKRLFHFWLYKHFFVASPDMVELLEREAPGSFETVPIDWVFNDGQALDGYVFLDVTKLHHAWDYKRSTVIVEMSRGRKHLRLGNGRAMRQDIPSEIKIFRDAYSRNEVLVSKDLAARIVQLASREIGFRDGATGRSVDVPASGGRGRLKARLKPAEIPSDNEALPLHRRLAIRVLPLLTEGRFAEAEAILTEWLQARAVTPYHIIAQLHVTTAPEECAAYLDDFCLRAQAEHPLKAVYLEMNGFTINPDLWFCDAFGFRRAGDDDGHEWLGAFDSSADESLVITGLEPLQAVFDAQMSAGPLPDEYKDARTLAVALVIVKVQQLLQAALPLTNHLHCPLWGTAHDHYEYLVRIVGRTVQNPVV